MTAREAILSVVADKFKITDARLCKVVSVDTADNTCELDTYDTQARLTKVRLQADQGTGLLYIPKVGSFVVASEIYRFEYIVILYSDLESIQMLDGSYKGLVKVEGVLERLKNIEDKMNANKVIYNSHTHTGNNVPSIQVQSDITLSTLQDLENPLITHGKV